MQLTAQLKNMLSWTETKLKQGITGTYTNNDQKQINFTNGSGLNLANLAYRIIAKSIAGGATDTYDLSGALVDDFGDACVFTKVKAIYFINESDIQVTPTAAVLQLGGNANGLVGWVADKSDKIQLPAGGMIQIATPTAAGWAVTAGTGDILQVVGDGALAGQYSLLILGES